LPALHFVQRARALADIGGSAVAHDELSQPPYVAAVSSTPSDNLRARTIPLFEARVHGSVKPEYYEEFWMRDPVESEYRGVHSWCRVDWVRSVLYASGSSATRSP
jgi:hypothetical protein